MLGPHPEWLEKAVFYQIYPQSFYDANGDGIGDLQGIIEKLDYISYLGCNAIWINPCYVSPFLDAGYDVADYYNIDPRYGSNDDMKRLFAEADKRGIRVVLDFVPGHTSIEHPWFKESSKAYTNRYTNWYVWTDNPWDRGDGYTYFITGHGQRSGSYMPNFFYHQPCLNYGFGEPDPNKPWQLPVDHPDVKALREEMKNVMRFWLDMGASGFRVDMAYSLVKNDPDCRETKAFWQEIRCMLNAHYPQAALISEWCNPPQAIPAGFHIDFLLPHAYPYSTLFSSDCEDILAGRKIGTPSYFRKDGLGDITTFLDTYKCHLQNYGQRGYLSIIGCNHDNYRLALGRDQDELEVIFAFLLTMPGVPFIYYGDEIGMDYMRGLPSKEGGYQRTGSRTPMQWSDGPNAGFSAAPASDLYLPVSTGSEAPSVEKQVGRYDSLLETVRRLIKLRNEYPALGADGVFNPVFAEPHAYPFIYTRSYRDSTCLIALNPSSNDVEFTLSKQHQGQLLLGEGIHLTNTGECAKLFMKGVSYGIFALD